MKKLVILVICSFLTISLFTQEYIQIVKGTVVDIDTRMALVGASVILEGSVPVIGTITDFDGSFRLENIEAGRQSFVVSYLGYEDKVLNEITVGTGHEVILTIEMKESLTELKTVKVVANKDRSKPLNSMASISAQQLTVESTSRIAAGINDPGRTAQSFAGVSSVDDEDNELIIRGNSPRGMLWRMEGVPIPNPNHFTNGEGGSGGGVSAISTQVMANSDFYTGAFPAEYGNAISGVFDIKLRNGNSDKREYAIQAGALGAQLAAEGPIKQGSDASYLINYRYSTLKLLSYAGIDISGGDIVPDFQDISYKLNFPTKKMGRFSLWGLGGASTAGFKAEKDSTLWIYPGHTYSETEKHKLLILGATHNYIFGNNRTYLKTSAAYSKTDDQVLLDSFGTNYLKSVLSRNQFTYNTFSVNSFLNHKLNAKNIFRAGVTFTHQLFDLAATKRNYLINDLEAIISNSGNTNMFESYLHWQKRIDENIELNTGMHSTFFLLNKDFIVEPRIGLKWAVDEENTINLGFGMHSRAEPVSIYLAQRLGPENDVFLPNKNLKLTKALHMVVGHNWNFAKDFRFKWEVYYQLLTDVPVSLEDTTGTISSLNFSSAYTNESLVNEGSGRNYGFELTLEKFFSNSTYFLFTGSIFESKYTMPNGIERNTRFNDGYIFNLVTGKEFYVGKGGQNVFGANLRTIWKGGHRTIPVNVQASLVSGQEVRDYNRAFETKAPDYFRIDCGISFRKNNSSKSWIVSLDIQNVTNRLNTYYEYFSSYTQKIESYYMLGLIPVLNYRLEF